MKDFADSIGFFLVLATSTAILVTYEYYGSATFVALCAVAEILRVGVVTVIENLRD